MQGHKKSQTRPFLIFRMSRNGPFCNFSKAYCNTRRRRGAPWPSYDLTLRGCLAPSKVCLIRESRELSFQNLNKRGFSGDNHLSIAAKTMEIGSVEVWNEMWPKLKILLFKKLMIRTSFYSTTASQYVYLHSGIKKWGKKAKFQSDWETIYFL